MDVYVCNSCGRKTDSVYNYSVDGYIEEGNCYYNKGNYADAKRSYEQALGILERAGGCTSCKQSINRAIDQC